MAVYVDDLNTWTDKGLFAKGSCHMTADTLDELHAFAVKIGMKRAWFQRHRLAPHYDLTPSRRAVAVRLGAIEMSFREQKARGVGRTKAHGGTLPNYEEQ